MPPPAASRRPRRSCASSSRTCSRGASATTRPEGSTRRHTPHPPARGMTPEALRALLAEAKTIAVVGLSPKPWRPSHQVAQYLQAAGYRIVPVNPEHDTILGERGYPTLTAAAREHPIDIVDVFRRSDLVGPIVNEAIGIRPLLIWLQVGVVDEAARRSAAAAGIPFIMDRCLMADHRLLEVVPCAAPCPP